MTEYADVLKFWFGDPAGTEAQGAIEALQASVDR